jgi:magnesium chelatase family protein
VLAVARTFTLVGVAAREVHVEVDVRRGLPAFSLVGLPDTAVRESRERVRAAVSNSGFEFPLQRITASLAPADLRKAGPGFDLAIAAALLAASGELPSKVLTRHWLAGELALDGSIRPVAGVLAMAEEARRRGAPGIALAADNAAEAALVEGLEVVPLGSLRQLAALGKGELGPLRRCEPPAPDPDGEGPGLPDLADLRGQPYLRRALEVAAAGGHSLLIVGPPGAGKSLAARRLPSLYPPLSRAEAIEVTRIASACGRPPAPGTLAERPFRAPHHTISPAGLVGGGSPPRPGEVTVAHGGVLFLDELAEFSRPALEALRQPLEEGRITVTRARHRMELPCRFTLVAASNPCPCGRGEGARECRCPEPSVRHFRAKLSGALADRIDVSLRVEQPSAEALRSGPGERSASVRARVVAARERQAARHGPGRCNADMGPGQARRACRLGAGADELLDRSHARLGLSGRGYERVLRVARTLADLAGSDRVLTEHVGEALALRRRDGFAA